MTSSKIETKPQLYIPILILIKTKLFHYKYYKTVLLNTIKFHNFIKNPVKVFWDLFISIPLFFPKYTLPDQITNLCGFKNVVEKFLWFSLMGR